jgi:hypothetical protein
MQGVSNFKRDRGGKCRRSCNFNISWLQMPVIVANGETGKLTGEEYDGKNWY